MEQEGTRYHFLYREIITGIYTGRYKKDDVLPTLSEFCQMYDIGRNTVRKALQMLEEKGYIECAPRKQSRVCFEFDNPRYQSYYLEEIAARRESISDIYETMIIIMPDIFTTILKNVTTDERKKIAELTEQCGSKLTSQTEQELSERLCRVYDRAICLSKNNLLRQLFLSLYHFTQIPVSSSERQGFKFKGVFPFLKSLFRKFGQQVLDEDYKVLKEEISFFCKIIKKHIDSYLNKLSKNIDSERKTEFRWIVDGCSGMSYMLLASDIIKKIRDGTYQRGEILPSYAQLAQQAQVSEKTSRHAVAILNKLKVLSTVNGVGTQVNDKNDASVLLFVKDLGMRPNLNAFFEALQIFIVICRPVIQYSIKGMNQSERARLEEEIEQMEGVNRSKILDTLFGSISPVMSNLYEQLKMTLVWGYFFEKVWEEELRNLHIQKNIFVKALKVGDGVVFGDKVYAFSERLFFITKQYVNEQGAEILLIM